MVAACPRCAARYRVDPERIGPAGARLRCARCEAVFRVRVAQAQTPPLETPGASSPGDVPRPAEPRPAAPRPAPASAPARPPDEGPTLRDVDAPVDRSKLVLIADADIEAGKRTASSVASWGLAPVLVHDGVEAMLTIQRMLPAVVVLDAALPKMYGFQICEIVKRNESLKGTHVVLIGAIHDRDRYRRPPGELYGADVYVERPDLPDALVDVLRRFGLPVQLPDAPEAPSPVPAPPQAVVPAPPPPDLALDEPVLSPPVQPSAVSPAATAASPPVEDGLDEERRKAERLARIIVSDIVLYNAERFEAALAAGNVTTALAPALEEGRALFRQRIDERVRSGCDHVEQELLRVARERAGG